MSGNSFTHLLSSTELPERKSTSHNHNGTNDDADDFDVVSRRYLPRTYNPKASQTNKHQANNKNNDTSKHEIRRMTYSPPPLSSSSSQPLSDAYVQAISSKSVSRSPPVSASATPQSSPKLNGISHIDNRTPSNSRSTNNHVHRSVSSSPLLSSQHSTSSPLTLSNPNPSPSEQDLMQILDLFPSIDVGVIQTIYSDQRGNKDRVVEFLLEHNNDYVTSPILSTINNHNINHTQSQRREENDTAAGSDATATAPSLSYSDALKLTQSVAQSAHPTGVAGTLRSNDTRSVGSPVVEANDTIVHQLQSMGFELIDSQNAALAVNNKSNEDALNWLLQQNANEATNVHLSSDQLSTSTSSSERADRLTTLSDDILLHITAYLDLFDLGRCSRLNREMYPHIRSAYARVTSLSFATKQHWSDGRILNMIECFHDITSLSLRRCVNFNSYERLPHSCFGINVTELNLSAITTLTDDHVAAMMPLGTKLEKLYLADCSALTDESLEHIAHKCIHLRELSINGVDGVSSYGVQRLVEHCKTLRKLDSRFTRINGDALTFTTQNNRLHHLNISNCNRFSSISITARFCYLQSLVASKMVNAKTVNLTIPTLETLDLSLCRQVATLTLNCPKLNTLNCTGCLALTDIHIKSTTAAPQLKHLHLSQCRLIRTTSLNALIDMCRSTLVVLNLTGHMGVTDSVVQHIIEKCSALMSCSVSGCKNVTAERQQALQQHLQRRSDANTAIAHQIASRAVDRERDSIHWWPI